ncbi:MAG: hypothetical protein H6977_14605 [Gammaproteobacteria bacterium]|nr:hypothetical protein [Gammaproteobacteria bacterium]
MDKLVKIESRRLEDILPNAGLEESVAAAIGRDLPVATVIEQLATDGRPVDAIKLLAHALPKRESVWWACTCCRALDREARTPLDRDAIAAAEAWVYEPTEAHARAAYAEADKRGFLTAGGWAAVGAFWSSGSLAPEGQPAVPPADYLTGVAVSGAILLAAVAEPVAQTEARYEAYLRYGRDIAAGGTARNEKGEPS